MFAQDPTTYLDTKVHCRLYLPLENNNLPLRMVYKLPLMFLMNLKNRLFLTNHLSHLYLKFLKNLSYHPNHLYRSNLNFRLIH